MIILLNKHLKISVASNSRHLYWQAFILPVGWLGLTIGCGSGQICSMRLLIWRPGWRDSYSLGLVNLAVEGRCSTQHSNSLFDLCIVKIDILFHFILQLVMVSLNIQTSFVYLKTICISFSLNCLYLCNIIYVTYLLADSSINEQIYPWYCLFWYSELCNVSKVVIFNLYMWHLYLWQCTELAMSSTSLNLKRFLSFFPSVVLSSPCFLFSLSLVFFLLHFLCLFLKN